MCSLASKVLFSNLLVNPPPWCIYTTGLHDLVITLRQLTYLYFCYNSAATNELIAPYKGCIEYSIQWLYYVVIHECLDSFMRHSCMTTFVAALLQQKYKYVVNEALMYDHMI